MWLIVDTMLHLKRLPEWSHKAKVCQECYRTQRVWLELLDLFGGLRPNGSKLENSKI